MLIENHIAQVRVHGDRLVAVIAGAADLAVPTPTCPGWTLAELGRHVGRVHRWASASVRTAIDHEPSAEEQEAMWGAMPGDAELATWLSDGLDALVTALSTAPPDLACWSFLPAPSPLAFWARRQAHETAIHRVDADRAATSALATAAVAPSAVGAASAVGAVLPVGPDGVDLPIDLPVELAVDGIDELLLAFYSRPRNRVRSAETRTLGLVATDADAAWLTRFTPDGVRNERSAAAEVAEADAVVSASAATLYIGLWNRGTLAGTGDPAVPALWRDQANVRWS